MYTMLLDGEVLALSAWMRWFEFWSELVGGMAHHAVHTHAAVASAAIDAVHHHGAGMRAGSAECAVGDDLGDKVEALMRVTPTGVKRGWYLGAVMDESRRDLAHEVFQDDNPAHFRGVERMGMKPISYGADVLTQMLGAWRGVHARGNQTPHHLDVAFVKPVFVGSDRIYVWVPPVGSTGRCIRALVYESEAKRFVIVARLAVVPRNGRATKADWVNAVVSVGGMSRMLAQRWPGCIYMRQTLELTNSGRPHPLVMIRGQGEGVSGKYRNKVTVATHARGDEGRRLATGHALIRL